METIISVRGLRKVYSVGNEKVVALDNINLEIGRGQICCILGTSGSGKSTFLNQLAGLEKPSRGGVYIGKHNISKFGENQLAKFRQKYIGFIFQSYNLMTANTALENVAMPLMFRGVGKMERNRKAAAMLREVGLSERMHHRPSQMSGGQQQRVGIARAFVARPTIIFADEPTGNLDTKTTVEVMEMMVRMSRENNQTFILVTHDQYLSQYADRIVTLIDGNIVSDVENVSIVDRLSTEEITEDYRKKKESEAPVEGVAEAADGDTAGADGAVSDPEATGTETTDMETADTAGDDMVEADTADGAVSDPEATGTETADTETADTAGDDMVEADTAGADGAAGDPEATGTAADRIAAKTGMVEAEIAQVEAAVEAVEADVEKVEAAVEAVEADIEKVEMAVEAVDAQTVEADVEKVEAAVEAVEADIEKVEMAVEAVEATVEKFEMAIEAMDAQTAQTEMAEANRAQAHGESREGGAFHGALESLSTLEESGATQPGK